jgi:transcriptional regulator with XRE-family HTH domain
MDDQVLSQTDLIQRESSAEFPGHTAKSSQVRGTALEFARLLQHLRSERGWSKAELANRAELDPSSITRFEQGARAPERDTVLQVAGAMALPMRDRDGLLAAAGFRSELWDDPLLVELSQVLAEESLPVAARNEVRSVIRMAIAYCRLQRLDHP